MISVGILSYKRTDLLLLTLLDIVKTQNEIELVLLNNNEDVCIYQEITSIISQNKKITLKYIWDNVNYGVAIGRRKIVDECSGDILFVFDDDIHIENIDTIFDLCLDSFIADESLASIAFNIKEYDTCINNIFEIPHKNKKINMDEEFYTYYVIGAGNAIDVGKSRSVGNYPKDFGLYGFEEIDLSFRLINAGYKIKYIPECIVYHKKSPDGRFSNKTTNQLAFINRSKMAKRYLKNRYFISCLIVRGVFCIMKTKDINLCMSGIREVLNDSKNEKFNDTFYKYVKSVNGFLYW
ncbi:glycosyltransferase [Buttiauxella sp. B2]|uniref:glycosyltransferase family 2 protein n=1 Tax=Buttiauxella sp. B2 TaxID=2587812 RepID=UPI0011244965|nr:glycosyltransferase [Buttiauxella sp. B2]TNV21255.1 glycosyltransferase [Buttiauxella sp. B2]